MGQTSFCHYINIIQPVMAANPVVKGAYCNVVFTAPVSICHAALAAFIDKPDLFRHQNTGFASTCQNLSSIIVVK